MIDTTKPAVLLSLTFALDLAMVRVVTGDVGDEIHGPAENLLGDNVASGDNGRLLHELANLV